MVNIPECTEKLLQTLPPFMRMLGSSMRQQFGDDAQLSFGHIRMLAILHKHPRNLRDLAQLHHVKPSTMSRSVDLLVKREWVQRRSKPDNRREIELSLTEAGLEAYAAMTTHSQEMVAHLIEQLDDQERLELYLGLGVLQKMLGSIEQGCVGEQGNRGAGEQASRGAGEQGTE